MFDGVSDGVELGESDKVLDVGVGVVCLGSFDEVDVLYGCVGHVLVDGDDDVVLGKVVKDERNVSDKHIELCVWVMKRIGINVGSIG